MARRLLTVASLSSATIALVAGSVAPALATEATPSAEATATVAATEAAQANIAGADASADVIAAAAAETTAELQPGYAVALKDADGNITGYQNIAKEDLEGLAVLTIPEATDVKVGDALHAGLDPKGTNGALKTIANNPVLAGTWSSSDDKVFTVDAQGQIKAVGEGTATLTFNVSYYDPSSPLKFLPSELSFTKEITVKAAEETPAPVETTPAPAETTPAADPSTPAPAESTEAAAPEGEETVAPVETTEAATSVEVSDNSEAVGEEAAAETGVHYQNCRDVRDKLNRPIYAGEEGYSLDLDADGDGEGCEDEPNYTNDYSSSYYAADNTNYGYGEELASTGFDNVNLALAGFGLLAAGSAVIVYRGRRSAQ